MTDTAAALGAAFPREMLRSVSKGGTSLSYIPAPEVVHRLNDVLGPCGWSYEVLERWSAGVRETTSGTFPTVCMAHVRLFVTIDGTTAHKDGIGGQAVKFTKEENGGAPVDLGDEWKGAVSDALKKAAQAYEVGLELARKEDAIAAEQAQDHAEQEREQAQASAVEGGWESAAERDVVFSELRAATLRLDADARAPVQAAVRKAGFTKFTFTVEHSLWWNELLDIATPNDQDHISTDRGDGPASRESADGSGKDAPASTPVSANPSQEQLVP